MGDPKGFIKTKRQIAKYRPVCERILDYKEVVVLPANTHSKEQASRCMDCGTPFCHWGCPVGNYIPEWNDLLYHGHWKKAYELLQATNNFPEITGRLCPATCETACVLGINDDPVTCRENELAIIEYAFKKGWVKARPPKKRTGKSVAVVGSGPAGLAAADQLNKAGHNVTVFEKDDAIGGILRYGIPNFKLKKKILDRRIKILKKEGIKFKTSVNVGVGYFIKKLVKDHDAVCLAFGSRTPRDLKIEGRNLEGIHFAMDYLTQANRLNVKLKLTKEKIETKDKKVVVIGGGDTGADCVGTAHREGAACVVQIELLPQPSECRADDMPWPKYPMILKTSSSHEEGGQRNWSVSTNKFIGEAGVVKKLSCVQVEFGPEKDAKSCPIMREVPDSKFEIEADLVILAMGFIHPEKEGLLSELGANLTKRGTIQVKDDYSTSIKGVFAAGDVGRGASLIVWAIQEGRCAAESMDKYLGTEG